MYMEMRQNSEDGLIERFICLTRHVAYLIFDLMETNETLSFRLSAFSALLIEQQQILEEETDENRWLMAQPLMDATWQRKQTAKFVAQVVAIVHTFLDRHFDLVYLPEANDFVIRLRECLLSQSESQRYDNGGSATADDAWAECQAILFLKRIELHILDRKVEDELDAAMGCNGREETQCPSDFGGDDESV